MRKPPLAPRRFVRPAAHPPPSPSPRTHEKAKLKQVSSGPFVCSISKYCGKGRLSLPAGAEKGCPYLAFQNPPHQAAACFALGSLGSCEGRATNGRHAKQYPGPHDNTELPCVPTGFRLPKTIRAKRGLCVLACLVLGIRKTNRTNPSEWGTKDLGRNIFIDAYFRAGDPDKRS